MASATLKAIRTSAAGTNLGRKIFTDPLGIQPTSITKILRGAGLDIPPSISVTADVAQIILSGGAIARNIDDGAKIAQFIAPSASVINAAFDIFEVTGLLDPKSPAVQITGFILDAVLVVATGGLNLFADIAFLFDCFNALFGAADSRPQVRAQLYNKAQGDIKAWYQARERAQARAAAEAFADYHNKKLSVFEYLGKVATVAPDQFLTYFPQFKAFIPMTSIKKCFTETGTAVHGGVFGIGQDVTTESQTVCQNFATIINNRGVMQDAFIEEYIVKPYSAYILLQGMSKSEITSASQVGSATLASEMNLVYPRIHLSDLAILSMLPPYFKTIDDNFDVTSYLKNYAITPNDLGYSVIEDEMQNGTYGQVEAFKPAGLSINGIEIYDAAAAKYNGQAQNNNKEISDAIRFDKSGDIYSLTKCPTVNKMLKQWGAMPKLSPARLAKLPGNMVSDYRNIQNYWAAISVVEMMRNDPYFSHSNAFRWIDQYFPQKSELEDRHRQLQFTAVSRGLNLAARANIAGYVGVDPSKLKLSPPVPGQLVKVLN